jgi:hypothetical protein
MDILANMDACRWCEEKTPKQVVQSAEQLDVQSKNLLCGFDSSTEIFTNFKPFFQKNSVAPFLVKKLSQGGIALFPMSATFQRMDLQRRRGLVALMVLHAAACQVQLEIATTV